MAKRGRSRKDPSSPAGDDEQDIFLLEPEGSEATEPGERDDPAPSAHEQEAQPAASASEVECVTTERTGDSLTAAPSAHLAPAGEAERLDKCEVCMRKLMHGEIMVAPEFVFALVDYFSTDLPEVSDKAAFVAQLAARTQCVMVALFALAEEEGSVGELLGHTPPRKPSDDEPPDSFFAPRARSLVPLRYSSLPAVLLGSGLGFWQTRMLVLGYLLSALGAIRLTTATVGLLACAVLLPSVSGFPVAAFLCGYTWAQHQGAVRLRSMPVALSALTVALAPWGCLVAGSGA